MLPFGRAKAVIGNWPRWKSIDVDFRNAFPFGRLDVPLTVFAAAEPRRIVVAHFFMMPNSRRSFYRAPSAPLPTT